MVGVGGDRPVGTIWLPRGYSRCSRAPGVAINVGPPWPAVAGRWHGDWVRGLCLTTLTPLPPPLSLAFEMAQPELGAAETMFFTGGEERSSHPLSSGPHGRAHALPNAARAGGGPLLHVPSRHSPGKDGNSVGRGRGKDTADPGKLNLGPDGSAPALCLDHKCPFLV